MRLRSPGQHQVGKAGRRQETTEVTVARHRQVAQGQVQHKVGDAAVGAEAGLAAGLEHVAVAQRERRQRPFAAGLLIQLNLQLHRRRRQLRVQALGQELAAARDETRAYPGELAHRDVVEFEPPAQARGREPAIGGPRLQRRIFRQPQVHLARHPAAGPLPLGPQAGEEGLQPGHRHGFKRDARAVGRGGARSVGNAAVADPEAGVERRGGKRHAGQRLPGGAAHGAFAAPLALPVQAQRTAPLNVGK